MEAIEELSELSEAMRQAAAVLADEDVDETSSSSSKRLSTFLNVVALGNVVCSFFYSIISFLAFEVICWICSIFYFI